MDGIHIHRAKSDDVDMIAERSMQMIGFLFLNRINNTSKQNKVCIAHIAWYVCIFEQLISNAIQMAYRIFCWIYSLKDCLVIYIIQFLEWEFPLEDRSYYHFIFLFLTLLLERIFVLCSIIKWVRLWCASSVQLI